MFQSKRITITAILLMAVSAAATAVDNEAERVGASFSGIVSQVQNDFGFGFELVSPRFLGNAFAISATGKLNYVSSADWEPYGFAALSVLAGITSPTPTSNLYGKAGVVAIMPGDAVATDAVALGALGAFGFEFFFTQRRRGSYFIELGGVGTGAEADAISGSPIYANGFLANVGVRYYF